MPRSQQSDDDGGGQRPPDRAQTPPSPVGKSSLTMPTMPSAAVLPNRSAGGPSTMGVGKSSLTASLPPAPSPIALPPPVMLRDPNRRGQIVSSAVLRLDETHVQLAQTQQVIAERRTSVASTSSEGSTVSTGSLADLDGQVQELTAEVVQLQRVRPQLIVRSAPTNPANPANPANPGQGSSSTTTTTTTTTTQEAPAPRPPAPETLAPTPETPAPAPETPAPAPETPALAPVNEQQRQPARAPSPDPEPPPHVAVAVEADPEAPGFDYDWLKRAAKATSYGLQLTGAAVSMLGWAAWAHIPHVQQIGQTSGSIGKNFAGSVGDFADYQDKTGKGENADGLLLKSGGQAISGVGQVINLAGIVATNGTVLRATGSFINALGMVVSGVGELQPPGEKKNVAKAATNFVGAAFAALGGVGFAIEHDAVAKVLDEVARSFEAAGSSSSAFTPFGGAADDAKNSKAAGDTKRARLLADPKPGGQAITAIGGVMNTAALILRGLASTAKTPDEALKMQIASRVLGSAGSMIQAVGNGFTAEGEWNPRKAPPRTEDPERGHEMATLAPA